MYDARLVCAVPHLTRLGVLDRTGDIGRHGANFRIRHQAARTQNLTQLTDDAHGIGACDHDVEIDLSGLDLLRQVFEADDVGTGGLGGIGILALREDSNAHGLARAVRHHGRTADLLVGLGRIDAQVDGHVHGFIEFRSRQFLDELECLIDRIRLARGKLVLPGLGTFRYGCHVTPLPRRRPCCGRYRQSCAHRHPNRWPSDPAS